MEVYLDLVMLLNFAVDFLLLCATGWLSGEQRNGWRAILAAGLGSIYAGLCLLPGMYFLGNGLWRIICLAGMSCIAFGVHRQTVCKGVLFLLLTVALGGIAQLVGRGGTVSIYISAALLLGLCFVAFHDKKVRRECVSVKITHNEKSVLLTALLDTGNMLRDPVTGHPALVVDSTVAQKLLGITEEELMHPIETISRGKHPGLRLIPYCAIGQPTGMLLCLRVDGLYINGEISDQIVAFAPQRIGQGHGYEALVGGVI